MRDSCNTVYPRDMVCFRYIIVNTLHKGDKDNNKKAENILKYKDLTIEIQRMYNVKARVIPVIMGANGTIAKSLSQDLSNTLGKHEIKEIKKKKPYLALHTNCGKR